jgi:hypothetical protein
MDYLHKIAEVLLQRMIIITVRRKSTDISDIEIYMYVYI